MISSQHALEAIFQHKKLAIFDLDGTLIDSEPIYAKGWQQALANYGFEISEETLQRMTGQSIQTNNKVIQAIVGEETIVQHVRQLREDYYYRALERGEIHLVAGSRDFLQQFANQSLTMAVASASKKEKVMKTLSTLGIKDYFVQVMAGDEVQLSKPDPEIYLRVLKKMNGTAEEAIAFEDSLSGVKSSTNAGITTLVVGDNGDTIIKELSSQQYSYIGGRIVSFSDILG